MKQPPPLLDVINSYCCVFVCLFVFTWKITHNHLIMGYSVCWIFFLINGENRMITTDTWRPWKKCLCTLSRFLLENIIFMQCSQIKAARHWRFIACMPYATPSHDYISLKPGNAWCHWGCYPGLLRENQSSEKVNNIFWSYTVSEPKSKLRSAFLASSCFEYTMGSLAFLGWVT